MKRRLVDVLVCPDCKEPLGLEPAVVDAAGFTALHAAADAICLHAAKV